MTDNNSEYYNGLWWKDYNAHGSLFWRNVDHNQDAYRYQEEVFRNHISYLVSHGITSVLELGAGTGRMTKIVLEELDVFEVIKRGATFEDRTRQMKNGNLSLFMESA